LIVRDTKRKNNEKLAKKGRGLGQVTYFSNFGTPNISGMADDTNLYGLKVRDTKAKKIKNGSKGGVA